MRKITIFLLLAVLCGASALMAQDFQLYTSDNSELPVNSIYCINFDNNGNVWFGGQDDAATGLAYVSMLSRDGSDWMVYETQDAALGLDALEDRAFYIAVDDQNTKWFCTHYGVSYRKADGTAGVVEFTRDQYTRAVQTDACGNVYISQREDDRNNARLHVSSDYGATWEQWSMSDMGFVTLNEGNARPEAYDLKHDSKGQLWICTWYGVTSRKMDGTWQSVGDLEGKYTFAMTIDPDDNVWVPVNGEKNLYQIGPDET
ncbi:MAG: two-component regulator propeller domain-containing protein, partial [candidate division KSB1 bacterium]|nr:two-component regulator propeller domain-containing protein [candidate division KSB1 bacterium]